MHATRPRPALMAAVLCAAVLVALTAVESVPMGAHVQSIAMPFSACGSDPSGHGTCLVMDATAFAAFAARVPIGATIDLQNLPLGPTGRRAFGRVTRFSVSDRPDAASVVLLRGALYDESEVAVAAADYANGQTDVLSSDRSLFLALSPHGSNGYGVLRGRMYVLTTPWMSVDNMRPNVDAYISALRARARDVLGAHALGDDHTGAQMPNPASPAVHVSVLYDAHAADIPLDNIHLAPPRHAPQNPAGRVALNTTNANPNQRRAYAVAADVDYDMFRAKGFNYDATTSFYYTLLGSTDSIYARDFGANLYSSYLRIYTSPDPYPCCSSGEALDYMVRTWNPSSPYRALATLVSAKNLGGGIAYVRVLCYTPYAYAVNGNMVGYFPVPIRSYDPQNWDIYVFAHELGHVFGASHTHDLNPPADYCGVSPGCGPTAGTIMSYCHLCANGLSNIDLSFHQGTKNEVIPFISGVAC